MVPVGIKGSTSSVTRLQYSAVLSTATPLVSMLRRLVNNQLMFEVIVMAYVKMKPAVPPVMPFVLKMSVKAVETTSNSRKRRFTFPLLAEESCYKIYSESYKIASKTCIMTKQSRLSACSGHIRALHISAED